MRTAVLALLVLASLAGAARADGNDNDRQDKGAFGLGLVLGEPTGVAAKLYLADDRAIAVAIGDEFYGGGFQLTGDYLFHPYILSKHPEYVVPFYFGPGIRIVDYRNGGNESYGAVGARLVGGLLFDFKNNVPIDVFLEAAVVVEYGFDHHGAGSALNARRRRPVLLLIRIC